FVESAELFIEGEPGARHMKQCILFARIDCHAVFAGHGWIYELQQHLIADALDVSIAPDLKRKCAGRAATFLDRPIVSSARGVGFNLVRFTINDVDAPAIGFPAWDTLREPLVRIRNPLVMI